METLDLGRTLCELADVATHDLDQGRSLLPLLCGDAERHRDTVYCEMGCDHMLFDGQWKLMWGDPRLDTRKLGRLHLDKPVTLPPSPPRLYNLNDDPHETTDLAEAHEHQATRLRLVEKLVTRLNENRQPRPNKSRGEYRPVRPAKP